MTRRPTFLASRLLAAAVVMTACQPDATVAPTEQGAQVFWATRSDQQAITMALTPEFDTLRLDVRAVSPDGAPLEGFPAPIFLSTNVNSVTVSDDGQLHAIGLTPGTVVYASITYRGETHLDTITVAVTEDPGTATVASFSMQAPPGDSARFALAGSILEPFKVLPTTILDGDGNPVAGIPVKFTSLDTRVALVDPFGGSITGNRFGYVKISGAMTAYHRRFADTVNFRIDRPLLAKVKVHGPFYALVPYTQGSLDPDSVVIGVGGVVQWEDAGMLPGTINRITFDSSMLAFVDSVPEQDACVQYGLECDGTGDIPPWGTSADPNVDYFMNYSRARRFTAPGVYHVQNVGWNTQMKIVVLDEAAP